MFARPILVAPAAALDRARSAVLSSIGRPLASLFSDRDRRLAWGGALSIAFALTLTIIAPSLLLAWGPLLLGVPHLVADARYLIVRRGLIHRPWVLALILGPAAATWIGGGAAVGLLAIVGAGIALRRVGIVLLGALLVLMASRLGRSADIALAHLHNVIAIVLFVAWRRRRSRAHAMLVGGFVLASLAIMSGALDRWAIPALLAAPRVNEWVPQLSLGGSPIVAVRMTLLFAFAQSVHYAVWLRLLPDEDRERRAPRPFVRSLDALARDLSWPVVTIAALASIAFVVWGALDAVTARDGYLRLATFHGPMELGVLALLLCERRA